MAISATDLARTTVGTRLVLHELGLAMYQFAVEPREDGWALLLECGTREGWQSLELRIEPARVQAAVEDAEVRLQLADEWRRSLSSCRIVPHLVRGSDGPSPDA